MGILLVPERLDRTLAAGTYRTQRRVPAEIGQVKSQGKAFLEEILSVPGRVRLIIDITLLYRLWNFPSLDKEGWCVAPGWFEMVIPQVR